MRVQNRQSSSGWTSVVHSLGQTQKPDGGGFDEGRIADGARSVEAACPAELKKFLWLDFDFLVFNTKNERGLREHVRSQGRIRGFAHNVKVLLEDTSST